MSKQYGSIFTVYFGPKKVVVLAGHQTVKQALVNHAEEFGDRDITPLFTEYNRGYGKGVYCAMNIFLKPVQLQLIACHLQFIKHCWYRNE